MIDKKELELAAKHKIKIISISDAGYPEILKKIFDPPKALYVKGELREEDNLSIAIVGSRLASSYGLIQAEKFGFDLANLGITVVSGLARGIDTKAHLGALKANGRTIAVLGSGLLSVYPPENKGLVEKISQNGAVISEYPLDMGPRRENFPKRNRIVTGLSLGVVVVEAAKNSGALISARCALEQGREVFSLPGKLDSDNSFGTNELIKDGAKLTTSVNDILEEIAPFIKNKTLICEGK
ncbi:MAG: DNA-processing protein DprA [Candidatus Omnitrophota bacterium]